MEDILDINNETGEIILSGSKEDQELIQKTKIKAVNLLSPNDFVMIQGTWEAKRDALIKILSSLPISYEWTIKNRELTKDHSLIEGTLSVVTGSITRKADSMGICERNELKQGGLHFMNARAETRALKRAIETLFGSVINFYVVRYLA